MFLHCRGANREVTGSRHLLEVNGKKILLDCGMFQGRRSEEKDKNMNFTFDPKEVDMVVISHAHIDHCGNLPNLVKQGFKGPIYTTQATADLMEFMLKDSAHIQESEMMYLNKKRMARGQELLEPLYTTADVEATLPLIQSQPYHTCVHLSEGVDVCFYEAGHILGSALLEFTIHDQADGKAKKFVFTGDLGRPNMPLIRDPYQIPEADILMMESTYGNRVHESLIEAEEKLIHAISTTAAQGGRVLIPAFSLGRTQEIVYALHKLYDEAKIPNLPIFVDSPLSVNVTSVFGNHLDQLDEETQKLFLQDGKKPFEFTSLKYVTSVEESKALNNHHGPCIIISSSGMMEHGRILHHIKNAIEDHRNTLIVVGYQAENTLGRKLVDGLKEVNIFGEPHQVKMGIVVMNAYSAHADRSDLLDYAGKIKGLKKIILVHGETDSMEDLKLALEANGHVEVLMPNFGDDLEL